MRGVTVSAVAGSHPGAVPRPKLRARRIVFLLQGLLPTRQCLALQFAAHTSISESGFMLSGRITGIPQPLPVSGLHALDLL